MLNIQAKTLSRLLGGVGVGVGGKYTCTFCFFSFGILSLKVAYSHRTGLEVFLVDSQLEAYEKKFQETTGYSLTETVTIISCYLEKQLIDNG